MSLWKRRARPSEPAPEPGPADRRRVVLAYHQRTKHHPFRPAPGPGYLDWDNQPDPFRAYAGAECTPLPAVAADPRVPYERAYARDLPAPVALNVASLSRLLYESLAISAWKQAGEARWALRCNPSSGNLHPTEGSLLLPPVDGLHGTPGFFHYAPRGHELELRAEWTPAAWRALVGEERRDVFFVLLSSIHWREAWKYGERAFRYCHHDVGHAVGALAVAAAGLGWGCRLVDAPGTDELTRLAGLQASRGPEAEYAECLVAVGAVEALTVDVSGALAALGEATWRGRPNDLSPDHVEWQAIEAARLATVKEAGECAPDSAEAPTAPPPESPACGRTLHDVVRGRRSGLAFDGRTGMSREAFLGMLRRSDRRRSPRPHAALPWRPRVHFALFVHRVEGLTPGLYWLHRAGDSAAARAAMRPEFLWEPVEGAEDLDLSLLLPMDLRRASSDLSCNQDIAGDGAFSLGMVAELEGSLEEHGAWFYPRLYWEAGLAGQVLYLEAEAAGLRATGIGCFFDDSVHSLLGLSGHAWQSLYHFTVGAPVEDERLTTLPAYPHLADGTGPEEPQP